MDYIDGRILYIFKEDLKEEKQNQDVENVILSDLKSNVNHLVISSDVVIVSLKGKFRVLKSMINQ